MSKSCLVGSAVTDLNPDDLLYHPDLFSLDRFSEWFNSLDGPAA